MPPLSCPAIRTRSDSLPMDSLVQLFSATLRLLRAAAATTDTTYILVFRYCISVSQAGVCCLLFAKLCHRPLPCSLLLCDCCSPCFGELRCSCFTQFAACGELFSERQPLEFTLFNIRPRSMARTKQTARGKKGEKRERGKEQADGRKLILAGRSGQVVL